MAEPQACDRSEKRSRPVDAEKVDEEVEEVGEVGEDEDEEEVGEGEEVDADLRGRPTGGVFSSYVPEGMVPRKKQKQKQKPAKQQPRRKLHRNAKIQKKQPCKGGHTDRDISGPKLKKAVIAELKLRGPTSIPAKDKKPDAAGRVLHFPVDVVIHGESHAVAKCYLPALRYVSGVDKILPPSVTNILVNADKLQINLVRTHL